MQKQSAKLSNEGPYGISERGEPDATASFASSNIYPDYRYIIFSVQEITILLNLS